MGRIQLLPSNIADKIAAGEVIERPSSVVKELVENSIDANASRIDVEISDGGKELIRVTDNGDGIHPDDLAVAFMRHATSKILSADDLFAIQTLGFRGEALPSIASVSEMTVRSRYRDCANGLELSGNVTKATPEPVGMAQGTVVEVKRLFYNTPARYKFLKTTGTEKRHITEMLTQMALANPHIAFRLVSDGEQVLVTSGKGILLDVIGQIYNYKTAKAVISIDYKTEAGAVLGYVGKPDLMRKNRSAQTFVLNGRVIQSLTIRHALEKAYSGFLSHRTFPFAVVILELNPEEVDVNVHPAKAEVRFQKEREVFQLVFEGVRRVLTQSDLSRSYQQHRAVEYVKPIETVKELPPQQNSTLPFEGNDSYLWEPDTWESVDRLLRENLGQKMPTEEGTGVLSGGEKIRNGLKQGRIIGQLHQTYILLETEEGLLILDQHIVHERILYEKLFSKVGKKSHVQQILPEVLEFSAHEYQLIQEHQKELTDIGVELEAFGRNSWLLRGLPNFLADSKGDWDSLILEVVDSLRLGNKWREKAVSVLACHSSVKAGVYLTNDQIRQLLNELAETENPFTCPHGRPIIIKLENRELERRFQRI